MPRTRIIIADDHAVVADGLAEILRRHFDVVDIVHDGRALVDAVRHL
jgi:DNA-binding NarL/FixJ family response regulator